MIGLRKKAEAQKQRAEEQAQDSTSASPVPSRCASPRTLHINKDLQELQLPTCVRMRFPKQGDVRNIEFIIKVDDGMWEGGQFLFLVTYPPTYNNTPPKVTCKTKIYHPNIDFDGSVCLSILHDTDWTAAMNTDSVVQGLCYLFHEPNETDPLNKEAAQLMGRDIEQFKRRVRDSFKGGNYFGQVFERQPVRYD
ncbi:putative NEDD8-conjugating enzyme UBC12 [Blattamonas nauphoetae]|uniref:NEDD8-conjugating enzyme UBC12 n=1 Tax=Blattamonas nauphoetae TaxID=2049346 RepID=A0ABQ9X3Q5_9EUKA|nr:putative NEDD8-conjugating enzyme UBC12 [Blattamonas nauphoetae]